MKSILIFIALFIFPLAILHAQVPDSMKYTVLTAPKFQKELNGRSDAVLIDVRDSKDYLKARIKGAINIDFPVTEKYFGKPDAIAIDRSLFIYCYAGNRSRKAAVVFYNHGYRNIYSLKGGFISWKAMRMPVEKKKHPRPR